MRVWESKPTTRGLSNETETSGRGGSRCTGRPSLALAQSSVTISGFFKSSLESHRIGSGAVPRATNTSETRVTDDASRIMFNVVEDLGGGLQAIGQMELRFPIASGNVVSANGNTHVGLRSKSMGRFFVGRQDVHHLNTESNLTSLAGDLRADSVSLLAYMRDGQTAIANASRTPNLIHYTTPNFSGFTAIVAYSTGPGGNAIGTATTSTPFASGASATVGATGGAGIGQGDLSTTVRKGNAFHINPNYEASNFQVGYSYWNGKPDGGGALLNSGDQKSNKLYGSFNMAGFKVGLSWDKSTVRSSVAGAGIVGVAGIGGVVGGAIASGTNIGERTAWSLPVSYTMGNNQFHFHYTKARDDRATAQQDGAKMVALSYQYTLSKRTSVGLTYAKITNDVGAQYNLFTVNSLGNSANSVVAAGEDPRVFAGTIRHAF